MGAKSKKEKYVISPEWTPNRRKAVEDYIVELQKVLRLQDWNITVDWTQPCDEISLATNDPLEDQKYATITVSDKFIPLTPGVQTQTLVHEMIHCHLSTLTDLAEYTVKSLAKKEGNDIFLIAFSQVAELATDALADAFYPLIKPFALPAKEVEVESPVKRAKLNSVDSNRKVAKKAAVKKN
jgi:hypothetical protein